jgi:hypothetical protein
MKSKNVSQLMLKYDTISALTIYLKMKKIIIYIYILFTNSLFFIHPYIMSMFPEVLSIISLYFKDLLLALLVRKRFTENEIL